MRDPYPSDLSDAEWALLAPLLPPPKPTGHPRKWPDRLVTDAVFYVLRSGCAWRMPPREFPPWPTVLRRRAGRTPGPSAAIIDSRSAKTTGVGGPARGYDGAQRLNGRERPILVDALGLLLAVSWPRVVIPRVVPRDRVGPAGDAGPRGRRARQAGACVAAESLGAGPPRPRPLRRQHEDLACPRAARASAASLTSARSSAPTRMTGAVLFTLFDAAARVLARHGEPRLTARYGVRVSRGAGAARKAASACMAAPNSVHSAPSA